MLTKDEEVLSALTQDPVSAALGYPLRVVVDYALKLTLMAAAVTEDDVTLLHSAGFSGRCDP